MLGKEKGARMSWRSVCQRFCEWLRKQQNNSDFCNGKRGKFQFLRPPLSRSVRLGWVWLGRRVAGRLGGTLVTRRAAGRAEQGPSVEGALMFSQHRAFRGWFAVFRELIPNALARCQRGRLHSVDAAFPGDVERISRARLPRTVGRLFGKSSCFTGAEISRDIPCKPRRLRS